MCAGSTETEIQTDLLLKQLGARPDQIFGMEVPVSELRELLAKGLAAKPPQGQSVPAQ